jgi:hypothetical protein
VGSGPWLDRARRVKLERGIIALVTLDPTIGHE